MSPNVKLTVDLLVKSIYPTLSGSMIGSLLYLTTSRPDISKVLEFVLNIKLILKNLMLLLSSVLSNTSNQLVILVFGMIRILMMLARYFDAD